MTPADVTTLLAVWPPPDELRAALAKSAAVATIIAADLDEATDTALAQMLPTMIRSIRNAQAARTAS